MNRNLKIIISGIVLFLVGVFFPFSASETFLSSSEDIFCLQAIRRVKDSDNHVSLPDALAILEKNGRSKEEWVYSELVKSVGGEEMFDYLIKHFGDDSSDPSLFFSYSEEDNILEITAFNTVKDREYEIRFLVFFEGSEGKIKDIAVKITQENDKDPPWLREGYGPLNLEYFVKLPQKFYPIIQTLLVSHPKADWDFNEAYKELGEGEYSFPIVTSMALDEESKEIFRRTAETNPVIRFLITGTKILNAGFSVDAQVFEYSPGGGEYEHVGKIPLRLLNSSFSVGTFAHEFWHFIYDNRLFEGGDINAVFGSRIPYDSFDEFIAQHDEGIDSETIEAARRNLAGYENIYMYMSKNHPDLFLALATDIFYRAFEEIEEIIAGETIAYLLETFTEPQNIGVGKTCLFGKKEVAIKVKSSDAEIFADLGLIPDWMRPSKLGFDKEYIDADYYDLVKNAQP